MHAQDVAEERTEIKADRTPFWMFYTSDWASAVIGFTLEQRGFYFECLRQMWERKAGLVDDIKWLAMALSCDPRTVRRLRSFLINQGKLKPVNGLLINSRAMKDIAGWKRRAEAKLGRSSGEDQPKLALRFPENPTESKVVPFPRWGISSHHQIHKEEEEEKSPRASLEDDEHKRRVRSIPASICKALATEIGDARAEALIDEYLTSDFAAGARHIGPAFKGWLRKEHGITISTRSGGNTLTPKELLDLCGTDEHGRPNTALPKVVRGRK